MVRQNMHERIGEFEQSLLFALLHLDTDEAYGVGIRREIERRTGREVSPGAIYTAMDRLEQRGLVASELGGAEPVRGGRRKRLYRLQPAGARALKSQWERMRRMAEGTLTRLDELAAGRDAGA
jgi:PadR family transcriptional regulator PadR